jgi:hypothetical protein
MRSPIETDAGFDAGTGPRMRTHHAPATARRVRMTTALIGTVCLIVPGAQGCGSAPESSRQAVARRPLTVLISGDTAGWIVPCGCTANQSGGLLRRATYARALRGGHDLVLVDAGGATGGGSLYDRLKFEAILQGERAMGVVAHNLGAPEAALGADMLRTLRKDQDVPFVSANLRDAHGALIAPPRVDVVAAGMTIAIVGVVSPRLIGKDLKADEPRDAVLRTIAPAQKPFDALVVLAYLPDAELRQLAANLPEADIVAGGPTGQALAPVRMGPTWLASATNKGKFLARFDRSAPGAAWTGEVVEMTPQIADDPAQRSTIDRFHNELARRDLPATATAFVPKLPPDLPATFQISGTESCRACHKDDCAAWDRSKHASAWTTLTARGDQVDPDCQRCHSNGYGLPGGFASLARSKAQTAVGCESCHGPSREHRLNTASRTPFTAKDQCAACHDPENSPDFAFAEYWQRIAHGTARAQPAATSGRNAP